MRASTARDNKKSLLNPTQMSENTLSPGIDIWLLIGRSSLSTSPCIRSHGYLGSICLLTDETLLSPNPYARSHNHVSVRRVLLEAGSSRHLSSFQSRTISKAIQHKTKYIGDAKHGDAVKGRALSELMQTQIRRSLSLSIT